MHNEVVKSDIHSTMPSASASWSSREPLLGFSLRAAFKNLKRRGFISSGVARGQTVSAWKIKPAGYADDEMVIQQWDEILRLDRAINSRKSQPRSIRRAQPFRSKHACIGVEGLRQVPKSLFILQVIDDPSAEAGHREQLDRIEHVAPVHARRLGRQSTGISTARKSTRDGGSLQATHQNCIIC